MKQRFFSIKPSGRKIIQDLLGNKSRTLMVVASIAVGVFALGMIAGAYFIIPSDMNASFASANPANIEILTDPFDNDLITSIQRIPGVRQAQGSWNTNVRLKVSHDQWTSFDLIATSDLSPERINAKRQLQGAQQPARQQVIIEKKTAEKYHIVPGDILDIELSDGTLRKIPVAGISQDLTSGIGGMMDNAKGYITEDTLNWLHAPEAFNRLYVTVKGDPNDLATINQVADQVIDKVEKSGRRVYTTERFQKNKHPMDSILQALLKVLLVLGVLIVFLSGSLISNTLAALIAQHLPQIGIMKLVGGRTSKIISMYIYLILTFSSLALLIAAPLGALAAYGLSAFAAGLIGFPLSGFRVIPLAVVIQIIVALAVPLIAGTPAILNGAKVTVQKAITGNAAGVQSSKKNLFDRWLAGLRGLSRPLLVSIRNTFRRKGRLALTLFTLTLGGAIFISVFNVQVSLNNKIMEITKYFGADVNLDFNRSYSSEKVELMAKKIPGVEHIEPWAMTSGELLGDNDVTKYNFSLLAPPADSKMVTPILLSGRWLVAGDEGALTVNEAFLRKYPDLKVGDTLRAKVGNRKADWTVVGIFQFTGVDSLIAYTNYDYLSRLLNQTSSTATYRISTSDHSITFQKNLSSQVDTIFRNNGFHVNNVEAGGEFTTSMTEYIGILTAFLIVMAMLTALVGSIGMAGSLSMNVMERTRELGVLRAIGAYDKVILRLVLIEGLIIGMLSFGMSALLSLPITSLLAEVISQAIFNAPAQFALTYQGFAIWLGVVLALSALSSLAPARSASKMTIREVLAYE